MLLLSSPLAIVLYFVLPTALRSWSNTVGRRSTWLRTWLDLVHHQHADVRPVDLEGQGWAQLATSVALWGVGPWCSAGCGSSAPRSPDGARSLPARGATGSFVAPLPRAGDTSP